MSNKKQTAVQQLIEKLIAKSKENDPNNFTIQIYFESNKDLIEQAKAMEKEKMIEFGFDTYCFISGIMKVPFEQLSENKLNSEHNYNETYENSKD